MSNVFDFEEARQRKTDRRAASMAAHPSSFDEWDDIFEQVRRTHLEAFEAVTARRVDELFEQLRHDARTDFGGSFRRGEAAIIDEVYVWKDSDEWREMCARVADASRRVTWTDPSAERRAETERAIELIERMARPS